MGSDDDKRHAAQAAAGEIADGMIVGLGTGSTAAHLVPLIAGLIRDGMALQVVATSLATARLAAAAGIASLPFETVARIDIAIDGIDEIDGQLRAIKGAGGAMLREKIVASAARRMIAIGDGSKRVTVLGQRPVPVEILPFARGFVLAALVEIGAAPVLRAGYRTDQDNLVADCRFSALPDPAATARALADIPGILGHGLFLTEIDRAYIVQAGQLSIFDRS